MPQELRPDRCGAYFTDSADPLTIEVHGEPNAVAWRWLTASGQTAKLVTYYPGEVRRRRYRVPPKRDVAVSFGVGFLNDTRKITRIIVPDYEAELDDPAYKVPGETFIRLSLKVWGVPERDSLPALIERVERMLAETAR